MRLVDLLLPVIFLSLANALRCTKHAHCDDGNPATHDTCLQKHAVCLSFSTDHQTSSTVVRKLEDLIGEINKVPISMRAKKKTALIAARMFSDFNPNIFAYRNIAGTDPGKTLKRFERKITKRTSNFDFHTGMADIFRTANDFHTVYRVPAPLNETEAVLGFTTKVFYKAGEIDKDGFPKRRYVVSDLVESLIPDNSSFGTGAELLRYNGMSIDAAVLREGDLSYAGNFDAQIAEGVVTISERFLLVAPLPKTAQVTIDYVTENGERGHITLPWIYMQMRDKKKAASMAKRQGMRIDVASSLLELKWTGTVRESKVEIEHPPKMSVRVAQDERTEIPVRPIFQDIFSAETIPTENGVIGRLSILGFDNADMPNSAVLTELLRLLLFMPPSGLIVDIRGNPGGTLTVAEDMANVITGGVRESYPGGWRATALVRDSFVSLNAQGIDSFSSIIAAVSSALRVKEPISGGTLALFDRSGLNTGGLYSGPIVTLVDGLTYSAGDLYAALQVDERMSLLVGTAGATGGGGAFVIPYKDLQEVFPSQLEQLPSPMAQFNTAFVRLYRSGINSGAQYENVGIEPDVRYNPTRDDAVNDDCDLYEFLGEILQVLGARNKTGKR